MEKSLPTPNSFLPWLGLNLIRTTVHRAWQSQQRVFTSTKLHRKFKWDNISPLSQYIPWYSTGNSGSILLEEMKSKIETILAMREPSTYGREIWVKIPNPASNLCTHGRKCENQIGRHAWTSCVSITEAHHAYGCRGPLTAHSCLWFTVHLDSPRTTLKPLDEALEHPLRKCTQNKKTFWVLVSVW